MNTAYKWLVLFLLCAVPAFAQNVRVDNVTFSSVQGFPFLPGATITICTAAGTGLPCTPTVSGTCLSISDVTCNQSATITADAFGNYGFWIQPGSYTYTVTKAGFGGFGPRALTVPCQPASTCTLTGLLTTNGITDASASGYNGKIGATTPNTGSFTTLAGALAKINGTCYVDGTTNATLAAAVTCAGTNGTVNIPMFAVPTLTANVTIPVGVTLHFEGGSPGLIQLGNFNLTINGPLVAPPTQVFNYTGTGVVSVASAATPLFANWFSGADIGVQINNAYGALPATGGQIYVAPIGSNGCYSYTTPIVMNTSNKYAWLQGAEPTTANPIAGGCLRFTPVTSTCIASGLAQGGSSPCIAINLDWTPNGGGGYAPSGGMRDITLTNGAADCGTIGGCGSTAIGIQLGGTNAGTHKGFFQNVKVVGFSKNWNVAADANQVGWGIAWNNSNNSFCGTGINYSINHENDAYTNGVIASCATGVNLSPANFGGEFRVAFSSFDDNSTCGINMADGAVLSITNSHFENGTQTTAYICGGTTASSKVSVSGTIFYDLVSGGTNNTTWIKAGLIDINAQLESGLGGRVQNTSPIVANTAGFVYVTPNPQMAFPTIPRTSTTIDITASNGGTSIFAPVHGYGEIAQPSGATLVNVGIGATYEDSTTHFVRFNPNNQGWQQVPQAVVLHTAYTNATTTFTTLSDGTRNMSFPILANQDATMTCDLAYSSSATTAGPKIQVTGPTAPTAVLLSAQGGTNIAAYADSAVTSFSTALTGFGTAGATGVNFILRITVGISNGVNAGTIALQLAANGAGTLTVPPGATCRLQ